MQGRWARSTGVIYLEYESSLRNLLKLNDHSRSFNGNVIGGSLAVLLYFVLFLDPKPVN